MKLAASSGLGTKKQAVLLGVLAVLLVLAVVRWRPGGGSSSSKRAAASKASASVAAGDEAAAAPSKGGRGKTRELQPDEVPMISPEDFAMNRPKEGTDSGRDLFGSPREPTRVPPPTPYPPPPPPGDTRFIGPLPPPPPTPTPRPPEISFKFVGTFGPKNHPIAVIQEGDKVYNVRAGDILFDKFVLRNVGYESLDIGFVGFPETESRRIGITPN